MNIKELWHVQTFSFLDVPLVLFLIAFELFLSIDNIVVLRLLIYRLTEAKQKQALFTGIISSLIFRLATTLYTIYIVHVLWLQILGGLYLLYMTYEHLFSKSALHQAHALEPSSLFKTICKVEFYDILFAIDSVLASFALVLLYYPMGMLPSKLWVIYLGGVLGIILMRVSTIKFIHFFKTRPWLERWVFFLVGWIGLKMCIHPFSIYFANPLLGSVIDIIFWIGFIFLLLLALFLSTKSMKKR